MASIKDLPQAICRPAEPPRNSGLLKAAVTGLSALLLGQGIAAIVIVSQMHQKQKDFEIRLQERRVEFERRLKEHTSIDAHGIVAQTLREHEIRLDGQSRSLDTIRGSNQRLANDLYQFRTDLKVLEQRVDQEHRHPPIDY